MISRYEDLYPLCQVELPKCPTPLLLQHLQLTGRDFCRMTESWHERLTMNLVDDQTDYVLSPSYDVEIIRPWKVWATGDEDDNPVDPQLYDFTPSTNTLSFDTAPDGYTNATAWATGTVYAVGVEASINNKTYECATAHTAAATFAADLAAGYWTDVTDDLIVKVVLLPRLFTCELAGYFMEKWAEGLAAGAVASLKSMKNKSWSDPQGAAEKRAQYDLFKALARRETYTENKQQPVMIQRTSWL